MLVSALSRSIRALPVCLILALLGGATSARAESWVPRDTLTPFVAALSATAASQHLGKCRVLVTPDGRVHRPCRLTLADLVGPARGVALKVTRSKVESLGSGPFRLRTAGVEASSAGRTVATFDVVEVINPMLDSAHPDPEAPVAVMWSRAIDDRAAAAAARAGTLPTPAAIADYTPPEMRGERAPLDSEDPQAFTSIQDTVRGAEHFQQELSDGLEQDAVLLGSAAGQRWKGRRDAKAVAAWKTDLTQAGGIDISGGQLMAVAVSHFVGKTAGPGPGEQPATLTYVALVVKTLFMLPGGSFAPRLALVKLAIAQ